MKQLNTFDKGILSDLSYSRMSSGNWTFPSHNIRVFNKRGQGFVVTTQTGNEKIFEVSLGFVIIAAVEHRGIIYLISVMKVHYEYITEIGCYPYPKAWHGQNPNPDDTGFVDEYGVLHNLAFPLEGSSVPLVPNIMRTARFKYHVKSNLKMIIDDAFDESVNLYLCDGENSDKVVNSGFRINGSLNGLVYNIADFEGKINHVLYTLSPINVNSINVPNGGKLKPGQYHIFFCYKTATYDKTEYSMETTPISVFNGNYLVDINGESNLNSKGEQNYTNKKIELNLSNVDVHYRYVSVGVMRFFSDGDGFVQHEEYEIAKDMVIVGPEMKFILTGEEDITILTNDQLYNEYLKERISVDHAFYDARLYKANLRGNSIDNSALAALALKATITTHQDVDAVKGLWYYDFVHDGKNEPFTYQKPDEIFNKLGYFDGEVYPFSIQFLMLNGVLSSPFPIMGREDTNIPAPVITNPNPKGLFRFKQTDDDNHDIYGAAIYIKDIVDELKNNEVYKDVKGFYIMRGDRMKNMLYDGIMEKTAKGVSLSQNRKMTSEQSKHDCFYYNRSKLWFASEDERNAYHIPVFRYGHLFKNNSYPRHSDNYYSFPHACHNYNGTEADNIITDVLISKGEHKYEYSIAVEHPAIVPDNNNAHNGDGDSAVDTTINDAIDTKLVISDDHFAIFSPDFMTEVHHETDNGETYYLKIYKRYSSPTYREGSAGLMRPGLNNTTEDLISSRTRVIEFGEGFGGFTQASTLNECNTEILMSGGTPAFDDPLEWESCGQIPFDSFDEWVEGYKYGPGELDESMTSVILDTCVFDQLNFSLVRHNSILWICVKDVHPTATGTEPGHGTPGGPVYWLEVIHIEKFSKEYATDDFDPGYTTYRNGRYELPSCNNRVYTIPSLTVPSQENIIKPFKIYNIEKGTHKAVGKFSSYAEDGEEFESKGKKGLYSLTGYFSHFDKKIFGNVELSHKLVHYNRSYQTPAYMGIILNLKNPEFVYEDGIALMCKVYKEDPTYDKIDPVTGKTFFQRKIDLFNPQYTKYWKVSELIDSSYSQDEKVVYKGDNFKSQSWFRMSHSVDFDSNNVAGRLSKRFMSWYRGEDGFFGGGLKMKEHKYFKSGNLLDAGYDHGIMYGIFTQNKRNISLRSIIDVEDKENNLLSYKFFPYVAGHDDPLGWIFSTGDKSNLVESLNINEGYNDVSGYVKAIGYDSQKPIDSTLKKTRVAFSERRIVESFRDGYRAMNIENKVDFETNYGAILRIEELFGILFTFREKAVFSHKVGQKDITKNLQYTDSNIYLSENTTQVIYYGIQDFGAFVKTKNAIYAVDVDNSLIFSLGVGTTSTGMNSPTPVLLSQKYMIEKELKNTLSILSGERTTAVDMNGIALGFNADYGEVYFSFINEDKIITLVYNENLRFFTGTNEIKASIYIPKGKSVLSTLNGSEGDNGAVYLNDVESDSNTFYGREVNSLLSFIVNGNSEKENSITLTKIFETLEINTNREKLYKIYYETEDQKGEYVFTENSSEFWKDAEWVEGTWHVPMILDNGLDDGEYYEQYSDLRGKWLKITLEFNGSQEFYIGEVITEFKQSFA